MPLDSILSPLLLISFMNDLPLYIDSPLGMYADDSTIHVTEKSIEELENKRNIDFKNVQIWCQNRMALHEENIIIMLTRYQRETKLPILEIK